MDLSSNFKIGNNFAIGVDNRGKECFGKIKRDTDQRNKHRSNKGTLFFQQQVWI